MKIGVLDSGIGGVAVLKELLRLPTQNHYIYYSDNLYAPYGSLNKDSLTKRLLTVCQTLTENGADCIVLLCNTATTVALAYLQNNLPVPVYGIRPCMAEINKKTLVLSTMLTAQHLLQENGSCGAEIMGLRSLSSEIEAAAPTFSALVPYLETLLAPYREFDTVLLACTHYIHLTPYIKKLMPYAIIKTGTTKITAEVSSFSVKETATKGDNTANFLFSGENKEFVYRRVLMGE